PMEARVKPRVLRHCCGCGLQGRGHLGGEDQVRPARCTGRFPQPADPGSRVKWPVFATTSRGETTSQAPKGERITIYPIRIVALASSPGSKVTSVNCPTVAKAARNESAQSLVAG